MAIENEVEMANDEGASPTADKAANASTANGDAKSGADTISSDDPHKVEKLANLGAAGDAAGGTE